MKSVMTGFGPGALRAMVLLAASATLAPQVYAAATAATAATAADGATGGTAAEWRQQKVDFPFAAFTTFYTCTGLEDKMRLILLAFGARPDLQVHAYSCDRASDKPNKTAWVSVQFSSLVPVGDDHAPGAIKANWKKVVLAPNRPHEMGMGECELVEQMGKMVKDGFTLRNVEYHTSCTPKHISIGDYSVSAESLQATTTLQAAAH